MTAIALPDLRHQAAHVSLRDDGKWLAIGSGTPAQVYWCVCCCRPILANADGLFLHDDHIRHPINMLFNDEGNPQ